MKKYLLVSFFLFTLLNMFYVYSDYENYKKELETKILNMINKDLIPNLEKNKKISESELLSEIKSKLEKLKETYKDSDFEKEVIQNIINNLKLNKTNKNNEGKDNKDNKDGQNGQEQQSQQNPNSVGGKTWINQSQGFTSLGNSGNSDKDSKMTQQEKDELTKYLQYLQDFSKQNQNFLRKGNNNKDSMQDAINNFFGNDPFFNNVIPSQDGGDNGRNW